MTHRYIILSICAAFAAVPAAAQEPETLDPPEIIGGPPSMELETLTPDAVQSSRPDVRGQISVARSGALLFAGMDADQDYRVTQAEFDASMKTAFNRADTDGSGAVSMIELETWRTKVLGSRDMMPGNLSFDVNVDHRVTRSEFKDALQFEFDRHDENEDGALTFEELLRLMDRPRQRRRDAQERPRRDPFANNSPQRVPRR